MGLTTRGPRRAGVLFLFIIAMMALPAAAQQGQATQADPPAAAEPQVEVVGVVRDETGGPLAGYLLVFRDLDDTTVFVSSASGADGGYSVMLVEGHEYVVISVMTSSGRRVEIDSGAPFVALSGVTHEVTLPLISEQPGIPEPAFAGGDRLFLGFIEDAVVVPHYWADGTIEAADFDGLDRWSVVATVAGQFSAIPDVEWGARIGFGGVDAAVPLATESGLTDLDLWGKLLLKPLGKGYVVSPGFRLTLPTGADAPGLGADAMTTKLFGAGRKAISWGVVTFNAGLSFSANGEVAGIPQEGKVALSLGGGLIVPVGDDFSLVSELTYGTEQFEDAGEDSRLLVGFNWYVRRIVNVRVAVDYGLTDGSAPNSQLFAGVAWTY